jgi:hypothetical protein
MVERNMCNADMRGIDVLPGGKEHITRKWIALEPGISHVWPSVVRVGGPHREGDEP